MRFLRRIGVAVVFAAAAPPIHAQRAVDGGPVTAVASPSLDSDHWAVRAAWRAEALGLAPGFFPAQRAASRATVAAALEEARGNARGTPYEALAEGWSLRFREEYPPSPADATEEATVGRPPLAVGSLAAGGGLVATQGRVAPGRGIYGSWESPTRIPDRATPRMAVAGDALAAGRVLLAAEVVADRDGVGADRWEISTRLGSWTASIGRTGIGYGPGRTGGIVFSSPPLPRVEVATAAPVRLPSFLSGLGEVTLNTFASRLDAGRHPGRPWLWGARVGVRPAPRLAFGVNRGAIFGGEGRPLTPGNLAGVLVGLLSDDFENQIVSVDARWRLPTDRTLPMTVYLEWGAEDAAGAWHRQPARTFGVMLPGLPGANGIAVGAERTSFGPCCAHGSWYTHFTFTGGWARGDALLGHPLGGEGSEWAVYSEVDAGHGLRFDARAFIRDRRAELPGTGNLLSPLAIGRSTGGELRARARIDERIVVEGRLSTDVGGPLRDRRGEIDLRYLLR